VANKKFYTDVEIKSDIIINGGTANTVPVLDGSKKLKASTVTNTELGQLSGVSSNIQGQINSEVTARTDADNTLQSNIDAVAADLAALPDPVVYKGTYNASTNTPALANTDTGKDGNLYYVTVAGSVNFGAGAISLAIGDKVVNNGTTWDKWDMTDAVSSVNGQQGAVVLKANDINRQDDSETVEASLVGLASDVATAQSAADAAQVDADQALADAATAQAAADAAQADIDNHLASNALSPAHMAEAITVDDSTFVGLPQEGGVNGTVQSKFSQLDFILTSVKAGNIYDIAPTEFVSTTNNVSTAADVTGFQIDTNVLGFESLVVAMVYGGTQLFVETFKLTGYHKADGSGHHWGISIESTGDDSGVVLSINNLGQIQYTTPNYGTFSSLHILFRANCHSIT
jgi:hypothetical protein